MNSGKMLFGIISGFIAGAVLGVIFAPKRGSDTRMDLLTKGDEYSDVAKEKFIEYVEIINNKLERVKKDVSEYSDLVKDKIREYKKDKDSAMN